MQTEGKMHTTDYKLFNWIVSPFASLRANSKQPSRGVIQANLNDIQANRSADFHND